MEQTTKMRRKAKSQFPPQQPSTTSDHVPGRAQQVPLAIVEIEFQEQQHQGKRGHQNLLRIGIVREHR